MPAPSVEDFWKLVAASKLVAADVLDTLRRDHAREASTPDASGVAALAKWLVLRGVLSKWQARRLLGGDSGPFFIGDYRLVERLENEGSGRLFRGRHEPSGRKVCLLLLDRKLCQRVDVWTEVVRRTTVATEATAPILSRTWVLEQAQGTRFIVCEDVAGVPLADELERLGPLPPTECLQLILPVVAAVAELHRRGAVHGGLSLDAVRREPPTEGGGPRSGRVRLLQMPLVGDPHAVPSQPPPDATERVSTLGRRASFVAPELLLPGRSADERSDVYALGCMLHALLTGTAPCWQGDAQRTLSQAAFVGPAPLAPPQAPVEVAALVSYMVARDPANRYPDAAEAADAIATCLGLPPVSASLPPPQPRTRSVAAGALDVQLPGRMTSPAPQPVETGSRSPAVVPTPSANRPRSERNTRVVVGISSAIAGLLLMLAIAAVVWRVGRHREEPPAEPPRTADDARSRPNDAGKTDRDTPDSGTAAAPEKPQPRRPATPRQELVDSRELPWASPTNGKPPTLAWLPPGSQLVLLARPASIAADPEGRLFLRSLGPQVATGIAALERLCGCGLGDIEALQAGWLSVTDTETAGAWTIRFQTPSRLATDTAARGRAWGETREKKVGDETIFVGKAAAFWSPAAEEGRVLVFGPPPLIEEMAGADRAGEKDAGDELRGSLPQDLEQLVGMLDQTRHLTLFGSPYYLANDGRGLLVGSLAGMAEPLEQFFGDGVQAAAVSVHFGDNLYLELDAIASRAEPAKVLAPRLGRQVEKLADTVEDAVAAIDPHPYGKKLVIRLPSMINVVAENARSGAEGKGVIVNAYLPRHAGHNLVLASELALEQARGGGGATATAQATTRPATTATRPLDKRISLAFARDTLERSVQLLSEEIGMPMRILGGDLQLEGITKNQSFGLDERDARAEDVLLTILSRSDPAGRLVYVVRSADGVESLDITTRAAVQKRGDTLPAIFSKDAAAKPAPGDKK